ncbi:protein disulfide-isomerase A6 homolog isoform X2 [Drosophila navojoa]|nr:protein disulfide-isomerase A6 homolog isoform X2 [Drosophila navojoa]
MAEVKRQIKDVIGGEGPAESDDSICMDSDVIELQPNDFKEQVLDSQDTWLVEFYTPWCPHCKNLAPEWIKVAKELKGKLKVGAVDASAHSELAAEYKVNGYPTIFYIPAQTEHAADAIEYKGSKRTAAGIIEWVNTQDLAVVPAFKIVEITNEDVLFNACVNEDWCMLAFLPTLKDCNAQCRNHMLNVLRGVGHKYKQQRWGWVWSEATAQMPLENGLRINYKYPSLAVVNCMKMKMGLFKGPLTTAAVDEFLANIAKGRGKLTTVSCDELPSIASIEPWDGKNSKKEPPAATHPISDEL